MAFICTTRSSTSVGECHSQCLSRGCSQVSDIDWKVFSSIHNELVTSAIEQNSLAFSNLHSYSRLNCEICIHSDVITAGWSYTNWAHFKIPNGWDVDVCRDVSTCAIEWNGLGSNRTLVLIVVVTIVRCIVTPPWC